MRLLVVIKPAAGFTLVCALPDPGPWSLIRFAGELVAVSAQSGPWTVRDGELTALARDPFQNPARIPFRPSAGWL